MDPVKELVEQSRELGEQVKTLAGKVEQSHEGFRNRLSAIEDTVRAIPAGGTLATMDGLKSELNRALDEQAQERRSAGILTGRERAACNVPDPWSQTGDYFEYEPDPKALIERSAKEGNVDGLNRVIGLATLDDAHKHFCRMAWDVQLLDAIGRYIVKNAGGEYRGFKRAFPKTAAKWARFQKLYGQHVRAASDALDTVDVGNWVPTGWSSEIREKIMLEAVVSAIFPSFQMPTSPFIIPVDMTDVYGNYMPETTDIVDRDITTGAVGQIQTVNDAQRTLTARKLRARFRLSGELNEDAIVAMLSYITRKIVRILAHTKDYAIINGQRAGVIDSNYTAGTFDPREAFDGLRKEADLRTAYVDFGGAATVTSVLAQRLEMGENAASTADLANIWGVSGYLKFLVSNAESAGLVEAMREQIVFPGEVSRIGGTPNIVSRDVPENLANNGKHDGVTQDKTVLITVNTETFVYGERRAVTVESERIIQTDQNEVVAMERGDFKAVLPTGKILSVGHNIPTA